MSVTVPLVFDLYGTDRLTEWKRFRDSLEISETPFNDLAEFWSRAPFVNRYLNPNDASSWPDPWKLILDGNFDDLAISLGMLYTIQLTERFRNSVCEIKQTLEKDPKSFLVIDNSSILNWQYRSVCRLDDLDDLETRVVWSTSKKV
jgi:hypothetical protein